MTTFINLTPHALTVIDAAGVEHVFEPSGQLARVSSSQEKLPDVGGFAVARTVWGAVTGVPDPKEGVVFIVSALVLAHCADRPDVVGPDTGPTAVRNDKGHIVAVRGFVK